LKLSSCNEVFGGFRRGLRLELHCLRLRDEREVRLRYVGRDLKVSRAHVVLGVVAKDLLLLDLRFALEAVEHRHRKADADTERHTIESERIVVRTHRRELVRRQRRRAAVLAREPGARTQRVEEHAAGKARCRLSRRLLGEDVRVGVRQRRGAITGVDVQVGQIRRARELDVRFGRRVARLARGDVRIHAAREIEHRIE